MSKTLSITIGIPAFNEADNILGIISDLLKQTRNGFRIKSIIVANDNSTDKTAQLVKNFSHPLVTLIDHKTRQGLASNQNSIIEKFDGDVLVLINADTTIKDREFIGKLISPIKNQNAVLTSAKITPLPAKNIFTKIINFSMSFKQSIYEKHNQGNNVYTCYGLSKAFNSKILKEFRFINGIGEDAFSYMWTVKNEQKFIAVKDCEIFYQSPTNISDHLLQSVRMWHSKEVYKKKFGEEFIKNIYRLDLWIILQVTFRYFLSNPIFFTSYLTITTYSWIKSQLRSFSNDKWQSATTTKSLINKL